MVPSASLADFLLGPLSNAGLLEDAEHLFVVPHGILNFLPFSVLPEELSGAVVTSQKG